jgi:hypothetical protein
MNKVHRINNKTTKAAIEDENHITMWKPTMNLGKTHKATKFPKWANIQYYYDYPGKRVNWVYKKEN